MKTKTDESSSLLKHKLRISALEDNLILEEPSNAGETPFMF